MYYLYSHNSDETINQVTSFKTRYMAMKYLLTLSRAGRMIHFYFISTLPYDKAIKRYSR
jgi:hypothetical protein